MTYSTVSFHLVRQLDMQDVEELLPLLCLEEMGSIDDTTDELLGMRWPLEGNDRVTVGLYRDLETQAWEVYISANVEDGRRIAQSLEEQVYRTLTNSRFEFSKVTRSWEQAK